jgi:hypothetical protein
MKARGSPQDELCDNDNCCLFDDPPNKFKVEGNAKEGEQKAA